MLDEIAQYIKYNEKDEEKYGESDITSYILKRFNNPINIDRSVRNISNNISVGNYLGFKDYYSLELFSNLDLYDLYFTIFPDNIDIEFSVILVFICGFLIILSMIRFCHKDIPNEGFNRKAILYGKLRIIILYLVVFLANFIYLTYKYDKIYTKLRHEELLEIKADPFFENLLKEIYDRNLKQYIVIIFICMHILSLILSILAWILSHHFTKKYLSLLEKTEETKNKELPLNQ